LIDYLIDYLTPGTAFYLILLMLFKLIWW
jgi:hypothetical protein